MDIDRFKWNLSARINELIGELEIIKRVMEAIPEIPEMEMHLARQSLLKSAVFSARVEGVVTDMNRFKNKETQNLLRTYQWVDKLQIWELKTEQVLKLHEMAMHGLCENPGKWRNEPWAIYNQAGVVIYLAPLHTEIPTLMDKWVKKIANISESPPVVSAIGQFILEKIHPFADGNGRVGRLVSTYLMNSRGWRMRGLVPVEEYVEAHREQYYLALEPSTDISAMIEFWLEALVVQGQKTIEEFKRPLILSPIDNLLPRRREIYQLINDHPQCSFDFIARRFLAVNKKTLQYDVAQLVKQGWLKKLGVTRGVVYERN